MTNEVEDDPLFLKVKSRNNVLVGVVAIRKDFFFWHAQEPSSAAFVQRSKFRYR